MRETGNIFCEKRVFVFLVESNRECNNKAFDKVLLGGKANAL